MNKEYIYEYAVISAQSAGELADLITRHLSMNSECQPWGNLVATANRFYQPVVYANEQGHKTGVSQ